MEAKTLLKTLKEASPFDLFLISFIALPFVFDAWLRILEELEFSQNAKTVSLGVVLLAYVIGIVAMLVGSKKERRRDTAKDQIIYYLKRNSLEMMRLITIREKINGNYDDDFLNSLPNTYPEEIRRTKLEGNAPGLGRILDSQQ